MLDELLCGARPDEFIVVNALLIYSLSIVVVSAAVARGVDRLPELGKAIGDVLLAAGTAWVLYDLLVGLQHIHYFG